MRDCDEARNAERNWQMPQQSWIQRALNLKKRYEKDRYTQKPGGTANGSGKPWEMNQLPPDLGQFF